MALRPETPPLRLASWIIATHKRPLLLGACLDSIFACHWPVGWSAEIVIARHHWDTGAAILIDSYRNFGITEVVLPETTTNTYAGVKRNAAVRAAHGELMLVSDDDDMQSPLRPKLAVEAYERGKRVSGIREFRFLHLPVGMVVRWRGRGRPGIAVGTARNYDANILRRMTWSARRRQIDSMLEARIVKRFGVREYDLGGELAETHISIQHDANVWNDRPIVAKHQTLLRGGYELHGEGHWSEAPNFPVAVARSLCLT